MVGIKWQEQQSSRFEAAEDFRENLEQSLKSCIYFKRLICVSGKNNLCSLLSLDAKSLAEMLIR